MPRVNRLCHRFVIVLTLIGAAALGCGGSGDGAGATEPTATASSPADGSPEEKLAVMFERLAKEVGTGGDCDHYAQVVGDWVTAHETDVQALVSDVETRSQTADSSAPYQELRGRLVDAVEVIVQGSVECRDHAGAQAAFAAFDQMMSS
ncbi:MAG TPA: hypothetical protein VFG83_11790 [Kofleriaceae bacterium]|nr:hypothetical protein [Kofleriaceae bacterium]